MGFSGLSRGRRTVGPGARGGATGRDRARRGAADPASGLRTKARCAGAHDAHEPGRSATDGPVRFRSTRVAVRRAMSRQAQMRRKRRSASSNAAPTRCRIVSPPRHRLDCTGRGPAPAEPAGGPGAPAVRGIGPVSGLRASRSPGPFRYETFRVDLDCFDHRAGWTMTNGRFRGPSFRRRLSGPPSRPRRPPGGVGPPPRIPCGRREFHAVRSHAPALRANMGRVRTRGGLRWP